MAANLNATHGAVYGSRLLNALLATDRMSRTDAYELVKGLAQSAMDTKRPLAELAAAHPRITELLPPADLAELFSPDYYLRNVGVAFERLGVARER
jgi:adenylosuccinate lyase